MNTELCRQHQPTVILDKCNTRVKHLRSEISACQRRISLAPLALRQSRFAVTEKYVFHPMRLIAYNGSAQMVQSTGFLLTWAHENPELLAEAVLAKRGQPTFSYIINCAIPAVFGYFASKENLDVAVRFYRYVAEKAPAKTAIRVFVPMMHNGVTYRFLEGALSRVLAAVIIDPNLRGGQTDVYVPIYGQFMGQCVRNALPLLPTSILSLFKELKRLNWAHADIHRLLFAAFLRPAIVAWGKSNACGPVILQIVDYMIQQADDVAGILEGLDMATSVYDIPIVCTPFSAKHMDLYVSIRDIHAITDLLASCDMLPANVSREDIKVVPPGCDFCCYACRIFRNDMAHETPGNDRSLFGGDPGSDVMEKLAVHTLHETELRKWLDVLHTQEDIVVTPFVMSETLRYAQMEKLPVATCCLRVSEILNLPRIEWSVYIWVIERQWKKWIGTDVNALVAVDQRYEQLMEQKHTVSDTASDFAKLMERVGSAKLVLAGAIALLPALDTSSWADRLRLLLRAMKLFVFVQKSADLDDSMYPLLFEQNKGKSFLSTFMVLHSFVMRNPQYLRCSESESVLWLKLETAILVSFEPDKQFLKDYIALQDRIDRKGRAFLSET